MGVFGQHRPEVAPDFPDQHLDLVCGFFREGEAQIAPEDARLVQAGADGAEYPATQGGGAFRREQPADAQENPECRRLDGPQELLQQRQPLHCLVERISQYQSGHVSGSGKSLWSGQIARGGGTAMVPRLPV